MEPIERIVQEAVQRVRANYRDATYDEDDLRSGDSDFVLLHNIRADIRLASRASELLVQVLLELKGTHETLFNDDASHHERELAWEIARRLSDDVELHIRQLYELLNAIHILIGKLSSSAPMPTQDVMEELQRLKDFRDLLVVHKDKAARPMRSMRTGPGDRLEMRIGGSIKPISQEDSAQIRAIFQRTSERLPPPDRQEMNSNEQLQLLYEHRGCVSPNDLADVKSLIGRNGVRSDTPGVLTKVVLDVARIYYPGASG